MGDMQEKDYQEWKSSLSVIDETKESIRFEPVFTWKASHAQFALELPSCTAKLAKLVKEADLVHSHPAYDLYRPVENIATAIALALHKKLIAITDMDNRRDAEMNYQLGRWSTKSYLLCKYVYDPIRDMQQRAYVKFSDLVLFKEPQQVHDYGHGQAHVRLFLDPNFHPDDIASDDVVAKKIKDLEDPDAPLRALYFGRLVPYKGVDRMIEAVALARAAGAHITFDIMGNGVEAPKLKALAEQLGVADVVRFLDARPYGESLFEVLREHHVLLACPLSADTPRSTWDALASAVPLFAFDTPFYHGIASYTGAVDVVPWPQIAPLGDKLTAYARNKRTLIPLVRNAVRAARENTGEEWLKKRVSWVEELFATP